jgi:FKBP-type peptidyl-prolyl cis-trans isomerase FkpA
MKTPFYRIASLVGLILAVVVGVSACGGGSGSGAVATPTDTSGSSAVTALSVTDTLVGTGAVAGNGSVVSINYTGWLYDKNAVGFRGKQFDSNISSATLFTFTVGTGGVIRGFDQGIAGMRVGGRRTLIIPSALAYGTTGAGTLIPANAALVFDVELVSLR